MPAIQIATLVVAILVSSGALVFFSRYGTRLAFAERDSANALKKTEEHDKEIAANQARVMLMEQTINDIRNSLSKLSGIDEIKATCEGLKERVEDVRNANAEFRAEIRELIGALPCRGCSNGHSTL